MLSKDKNKELTDKQMVNKLLQGIRSTDTSIASAKVKVYQNYRANFDRAVEFLSGLILSIHAAAQLDYANRHSVNKRRCVSAMGSNDQRGGPVKPVKEAAVLASVVVAAADGARWPRTWT